MAPQGRRIPAALAADDPTAYEIMEVHPNAQTFESWGDGETNHVQRKPLNVEPLTLNPAPYTPPGPVTRKGVRFSVRVIKPKFCTINSNP